jgi:phenylacetic acid degradation operon negative regulatory protein
MTPLPPRPTAKQLVLEFLSAAAPRPAPAAALIEACSLLDITENNVRVALARLTASGVLVASSRGEYKLGPETAPLTEQVTGWRDVERRVRRWDGGWVCVHTGALSRTDRAALRRRDRAFRLLGIREVVRGLEARPDNLEGGAPAVSARLSALGLEADAPVFRASGFDARQEERLRSLWDSRALDEGYRQLSARMERWLDKEPSLPRDVAARESYVIGREVLRAILFDPLLPEPLVDVEERHRMILLARTFDRVGRRIWFRLAGVPHGMAPEE